MRIRTITGLALAGVAAAGTAAVAGTADAGGGNEPASVVRTVTEDENSGGSTTGWDCPEKDGYGQGESGAPTTPEQPPTPAEAL